MKRYFPLMLLLLTGILFSACEKSDIESEKDYKKSYKVWLNFKSSSNNSYRYTVSTASWTGFSSETIITVSQGKVVGRNYVAKRIEYPSNQVTVYQQWEENEQSLNTHEAGAQSITLDVVYERAKTDWLQKRADATTYFETKNDGMISSCGYVENYCADDCFRGITITSIKKL